MKLKPLLLLVTSVVAVSLTQCNRQVASNTSSSKPAEAAKHNIRFIQNTEFQEVKSAALQKNKVIFVDIYTTWCGPCKYMEKEIFTDQKIADTFNKKFVNYKIDGESFAGVNMGIEYEISSYPTYLFVDGNGVLLHKVEGIRQVDALLEEADFALTMARN